MLCNFLVRTLQYLKKKLKKFAHKKLKKTPSKVAQKTSNPLFFLLLPKSAQAALTEEFMFQNVAYWPTVYITGDFTSNINQAW